MDIVPTLKQDFKAYMLAYEDGRNDLTVIFANRFISNVLFGADKYYTAVGYILRDVAMDNLKAEQVAGEAQKTVKKCSEDLIGDLEDLLNTTPLDVVGVWKLYHTYVQESRMALASKAEQNAYRENPDVTGEVITYLFQKFLLDDKEMAEPQTVVPHGCFNEINRLVTSHGISDRDTPILAVAATLPWLYDYVSHHWENQATTKEVGGDYVARVKKRFAELLKPITQLLDRAKFPNLEAVARPASDVLAEILLEWRREFIRYMDVGTETQKKIQVPISRETREKLSESIKGAIEKDLLGKKAKR